MNKTLVNNIRICIDAVKAINITTTKKAGYFSIFYDIKKVYDFCYDMTSCMLFEYDCCDSMVELKKAIEDLKSYTKKDLEKMCKRSINYLKYQLSELYSLHTITE